MYLYILDRNDGRMLWKRRIGGAASDPPALSNSVAYVTMLSGLIQGFSLVDPEERPWQYQSVGRTLYSPAVTGKVVSWPTTAGYLYAASATGRCMRGGLSVCVVIEQSAAGGSSGVGQKVANCRGNDAWRRDRDPLSWPKPVPKRRGLHQLHLDGRQDVAGWAQMGRAFGWPKSSVVLGSCALSGVPRLRFGLPMDATRSSTGTSDCPCLGVRFFQFPRLRFGVSEFPR